MALPTLHFAMRFCNQGHLTAPRHFQDADFRSGSCFTSKNMNLSVSDLKAAQNSVKVGALPVLQVDVDSSLCPLLLRIIITASLSEPTPVWLHCACVCVCLHSKFEVQNPQDTQELSDFVHVVHIANFGGAVPNSGYFHKLTDSTQDCSLLFCLYWLDSLGYYLTG